ncbi:MAG TPA: deoxyribonuclease IV [Thermoanaerobaculia bacterium]|nr:deoxyribonuclease IV [Thermoanaerobaculia bacterium]
MQLLGAHVSVAGGLPTAFTRSAALGCAALQIFVKNASRWQGRELTAAEADAFATAWRDCAEPPVVAHGAYLLNLAAPPGEVRERSRRGLADEIERSRRLGLAGLVVHPGAHLGAGEERGLLRVAASLDGVLGELEPGPRVLLEVTAGQGSALGWRLEHLERIVALSAHRERLGICLDTCHLFAAGYPVHRPEGLDDLLAEVDRRFGAERLGCIHLNDSQRPFASRRDRHANIGAGEIGRDAFAYLVRHPRLMGVPLILETPDDDGQGHARDLALLRELAAA